MTGHQPNSASVLFESTVKGLHARALAGRGSDILAVVFSQRRVPPGRFGLARLFARTSHNCLFLNQPSTQWYRGTDGAIDQAIDRARIASGAGRIVLYGSSMGGFGALATAPRWPEARVLAFAPDFAIGEASSRSRQSGLAPVPGEPDLADYLLAPRSGAIDIVIGVFDPYDAGVAARIADIAAPSARVVLASSGHEVHDHLYTVNVIRRIISGFGRDVAGALADRDLLHRSVARQNLSGFAKLGADFEAGRPPDAAEIRALELGGNPGVALLEAAVWEAAGHLAASEAVLAQLNEVIAASPTLSTLPKRYLKQIPLRRMKLLAQMGRTAEAEAVRRSAAADYPSEAGFRFAG